MKHQQHCRPIGKCRGCELNMRTFCAAGLEPKAEWDRGRCRSRNRLFSDTASFVPVLAGAKAAKQQRRLKATQLATKSHFDGFAAPSHYYRRSSLR